MELTLAVVAICAASVAWKALDVWLENKRLDGNSRRNDAWNSYVGACAKELELATNKSVPVAAEAAE